MEKGKMQDTFWYRVSAKKLLLLNKEYFIFFLLFQMQINFYTFRLLII